MFGNGQTAHFFIRSEGKRFYDAECLDGVEDHMDLPTFQRILAEGLGRQPIHCIDTNNLVACVGDESYRDFSEELLAYLQTK
jgi:hypothetical protein